jgi:hypothetical protein
MGSVLWFCGFSGEDPPERTTRPPHSSRTEIRPCALSSRPQSKYHGQDLSFHSIECRRTLSRTMTSSPGSIWQPRYVAAATMSCSCVMRSAARKQKAHWYMSVETSYPHRQPLVGFLSPQSRVNNLRDAY